MTQILDKAFYKQDVLELAPALIGKTLVRQNDDRLIRVVITETEAYRGEEDLACHARKGRTPRTDPMYYEGGILYIYLVYGIHWMLNIVCGPQNMPQAVLIRAVKTANGPGKLTKMLGVDKQLNYHPVWTGEKLWIEDSSQTVDVITDTRIGIDYAGAWKHKPWRFILKD